LFRYRQRNSNQRKLWIRTTPLPLSKDRPEPSIEHHDDGKSSRQKNMRAYVTNVKKAIAGKADLGIENLSRRSSANLDCRFTRTSAARMRKRRRPCESFLFWKTNCAQGGGAPPASWRRHQRARASRHFAAFKKNSRFAGHRVPFRQRLWALARGQRRQDGNRLHRTRTNPSCGKAISGAEGQDPSWLRRWNTLLPQISETARRMISKGVLERC